MTLVLTTPFGQPGQVVELLTSTQTPLRAMPVETDLNSCTAVAGFTTAAMLAAIATGAAEVCFPPGVYDLTSAVTSQTGQVLNFQPGAVLRFSASGAGQLILGDASQIIGKPVGRFDATSAVAYVAVDLRGVACSCAEWLWQVNADVGNCKLMRLSGDYSQAGKITYTGVGSFLIGTEYAHPDDSLVLWARSGPHYWQMTDDGVTTRNYSSLVRMRSTRSGLDSLYIAHGGRQLINAIVDVAGTHNWSENIQISSGAGANFGVLQRDDAEFFTINGGEIVGNYLANSVGISSGDGSKVVGTPAVGQLKCINVKVLNWDIGWLVTGSADTPGFTQCTIANNKTAQCRVDSQRGASVWPVSAPAFYNCYSEEQAFHGVPFLNLKSGQVLGGVVSCCEIGLTGTAVAVDAGMSTNIIDFDGGRYTASGPTDAITTPNAQSQFYFNRVATSGSNLLGKGAFAANAMSAFDPTLVGLVIGTLGAGTANNHITKVLTDLYTVGFGVVPANGFNTVDLGFSGLPTVTTAVLIPTMDHAGLVFAQQGIVFSWGIDAAGHIGGVAWNLTGAPITVAGIGMRFLIIGTG